MEDGKSVGECASPSPSSSSSDFYSTDVHAVPAVEERRSQRTPVAPGFTHHAEAKEALFPMSIAQVGALNDGLTPPEGPVSPSSSQSEDLFEQSHPAAPELVASPRSLGMKRKRSEAVDTNGAASLAQDTAKRPKLVLSSVVARLPPEIWQQIFLSLSPAMLCRCLRVSKAFNRLLTEKVASPLARKDMAKLCVLDGEVVWSHSRKCFYPNLPRPLAGFSESEMLQLIAGKACQFCRRTKGHAPGTTHFNAGPGRNGNRAVWPFGIRSCGECLKARVLTDTETLSTHKHFARLRSGVTFGYLLPDCNFVPETIRLTPPGIPSAHRASRVYYRPALEAIEREEKEAHAYGEGAADEWYKGLQTKGKNAMADCARWEDYERRLRTDRPGVSLLQVLRENDPFSFRSDTCDDGDTSRSAGVNGIQLPLAVNGAHPLPQPVHVFPNLTSQAQQQSRPNRNPAQIEEIRRLRKLDIERRCGDLNPPLMPGVLQHMDSFHAALQIAQPMTDEVWELLKPRIMAQQETAELAEHERSARLAAFQATLPDTLPKSNKETHDHEYEVAQQPLRNRLGRYADDLINGQWHGGKALTKENAPIFVVKVLRHVWKSYEQDQETDPLPRSDSVPLNHNRQGSPLREPFLSLDNMKWVYDHKVRPLADSHRRDHFLCAVCADVPSSSVKWFAFEGLIQHYGAKHTTAFSKGNIVVHWQSAPWPGEFPFHLQPEFWLKSERGPRDMKGKPRPRNTPQMSNEGIFFPPGKSSEAGMTIHGSGGASNAEGYANGHHPNSTVHVPQSFTQTQFETQPEITETHAEQLDKFADDVVDIWTALEGVEDLMDCMRVHTVLHHAAQTSQKHFAQSPSLDLMTDVLLREQEIRPLRNATGLACKICVAGSASKDTKAYYSRIRSVKLYNTWSLVAHFKLHTMEMPTLNWTRDMIELPENQLIRDLLHTNGMDDNKLALIANAIPGVFPSPLPRIGKVSGRRPGTQAGVIARAPDRQGKKNKKKKAIQHHHSNEHAAEHAQDGLPEAAEDEYDPRRPLMVPMEDRDPDPSRFDTDLAPQAASEVAAQSQNTFQIDSAILAALHQVKAPETGRSELVADRLSRSPSVGRTHPGPKAQGRPSVHGAKPFVTPDIASILKSLTANTASTPSATPTSTLGSTGSNTRRHIPSDSRKPTGDTPQLLAIDALQSQGPTGYANQAPATYTAQQLEDLQASLASGGWHPSRPQSSAPPPTWMPAAHQAHHSPHQYAQHRFVYHDEKRQEAAPVQYVQVPPQAREPIHLDYHAHYERPQHVNYIDQYGRPLELVPIEAAPPPPPPQVQYISHPHYDQPYQARPTTVYPTAASSTSQYQPVYDDRRQVYYEVP